MKGFLFSSLLIICLFNEIAAQGKWTVIGKSNVVCIHTALLPNNKLMCAERPHLTPYPQNPNTNGRVSTEIDLATGKVVVKEVLTNPFCAGHAQMASGNIFIAGGDNQSMSTNGEDFIVNGRRGRREYVVCPQGKTCADSESQWSILSDMTSERWYPTVVTLGDGSNIIIGGSTKNLDFEELVRTGININNPTYEYWPSRGEAKRLDLLVKTYPHNLYPISFQLPNGKVLIFSSNQTVLLNPKDDSIDGSVQPILLPNKQPWIYPHTPVAIILPLTIKNNYNTVVQVCGGTYFESPKNADPRCIQLDFGQTPLQWRQVDSKDQMPVGRLMPDAVLLPDGTILYTNGAGAGQAGGNSGQSQYAQKTVFQTDLFNPAQPSGSQWSKMADATVPRLYHSGALLIPDGRVVTTGSEMSNYKDFENKKPNCMPQADAYDPANCLDPFEYRIEAFEPPYLSKDVERPVIKSAPESATYGSSYSINMTTDGQQIEMVSFIRYATTTHSTNTDQRFIELKILGRTKDALYVEFPKDGNLAPPGNWMLFALRGGKPSVAATIMMKAGDVVRVTVPAGATLPTAAASNLRVSLLFVFAMVFLIL